MREPHLISLNDSQSQRTFSSDWGKKKKWEIIWAKIFNNNSQWICRLSFVSCCCFSCCYYWNYASIFMNVKNRAFSAYSIESNKLVKKILHFSGEFIQLFSWHSTSQSTGQTIYIMKSTTFDWLYLLTFGIKRHKGKPFCGFYFRLNRTICNNYAIELWFNFCHTPCYWLLRV